MWFSIIEGSLRNHPMFTLGLFNFCSYSIAVDRKETSLNVINVKLGLMEELAWG